MSIVITDVAQNYLVDLLGKQKLGAEIRVFLTEMGTPQARCGICFCFSDSFRSSDVVISFEFMSVRVEKSMIPFLKDSVIDVVMYGLHSKLTFKVPYARGLVQVNDSIEDSLSSITLEQKIKNVLELQINPQLSAHGGNVSLIDITEDFLVILKFSGGCNGCAMANYTMQLGIKAILQKVFPQLKGVRDVTEHYRGSHSYY